MDKKVTLQMVADHAGVSVVTVSNVLTGKKGASETVRNQILSIAQEMGYKGRSEKKSRESKAYRIGVMIAERYVKEYPSFYMDIYKKVAQEASKHSCLTILRVVGEEEERLEQEPMTFGYAGIQGIMMIGEMNPDFVAAVREKECSSLVCVDFYDVDKDMDFIVTDNYGRTQEMTRRLIEWGHRDIVFVGTPQATNSIMDRYMGYCKALFVNGIPNPRVICDRKKNQYWTMLDFELPDPLPTAFVCNCESSAHVLLKKLRGAGYRVPEDVSIVSFDRFQQEEDEGLDFTTYEADEEAMAEISIKTLMKRIEGKGKPDGIHMVEGRVREGNSAGMRREDEAWAKQ